MTKTSDKLPLEEDSPYREYLRDFAHEIGTPLNAMIGYAQLARHTLEKDADLEKMKEYVDIIEQSTVRLLRICEHVLDDAVSGEQKVNKVDVDAVLLCDEVISTFTEMARKRRIEMKSHFPDSFPMVNTDPVLVGQVMTNLISNAIKFTPPGGTINVRGEVDHNNEVMILMVRDTGEGISSSLLKQVMSKEKLASSEGHHGDKGWGRGLQIAQHIVERLGGDLAFAPATNGGTVVRFSLPLD